MRGGKSRRSAVRSQPTEQDPSFRAQDAIDKSQKWAAVAKSAVGRCSIPLENTGAGKQNKPSGKRAKMGRGVHTCRMGPPLHVSQG